MSTITLRDHRARIAADAVISAYINELGSPRAAAGPVRGRRGDVVVDAHRDELPAATADVHRDGRLRWHRRRAPGEHVAFGRARARVR